ncbi:hypothetical protein Fot_28783 [Forsythia ovata]|uniref:Uncharacterized protein n=1 Tax=Forsythia ovata TaxID=205694 RepID=A0ABD1TQ06_9LAMI
MEKINLFYVQQMSWKGGLAKKDEELGVLNAKAEGTELLDLIKDELPGINFDFFYEEGETASLALLLETYNTEAVAEPTSSEAITEPVARAFPFQQADSTIFDNLQD